MNKNLTDQFMKWNGSTNIACCLLTRIAGNTFSISAANTRFTERLKITDFESLEKIIENRDHLNKSLSHDAAEEWTVFCETMHCFLDCRCQRIEDNVCVLWISAAEQQPIDVLSDIPIGIIRMKVAQGPAKLHCTYMNSEALAMTGTSGNEASKCFHASDLMHVHSADACRIEHMLAMFISGKAMQPLECRLRPQDGHVRWIRVSLSWVIPQKVLQLAFVNISTEKETLAHNRQNQVLLQKILDTTQAAIFWKDAERRFTGVSKAFLEYYGFDSEQVLLGKNDEDMGWHSDPDPYKNDELRVLQGESTTRVPGMCFCKGENRHIVASKSPLYEDGKIVGLVGSFEDVTSEYMLRKDVVDLIAKLHAALKKERQANRAKSDFLLRMSHDMRTPLATIVGLSDLELKKHREPDLTKAFSTIKACSNFLLAILSDILDLQKLSNGKIDVTPTICTGAHSAKNIESIIRPQAEAKNITFITHFNCTATNCHAQIDTRKVQQIIVNLLNNAVKYTQPGGTITWRNDISGENADSIVVTHVISDNGPGISKKFQARMYSPFTQEDHVSSAGSGLGLAIVKNLVDILGGNITCKSAPGQGTTFTVILPHKKATAADITAFHKKNRTQHAAVPLEGRKILICEDNAINSEILKEMLESEGALCEQAFNGREGVEKARGRNYDIVMMDIRMPVMDGYQATREIREFDVDTPIVALSANVFADEIQNAFESGMDEFLEKPVVMSKMFSVLGQLLSTTSDAPLHGPD